MKSFLATALLSFVVFDCVDSALSSPSDSTTLDRNLGEEGLCDTLPKPSWKDKEKTARWMVHTLNWGVLSTISTRNNILHNDDSSSSAPPVPFGNVYSFVDGPCDKSTGIPYIYASGMDQSMKDVTSNNAVSFMLTEASLTNGLDSCVVQSGGYGDPEMPTCARVVITGRLEVVEENTEEEGMARNALLARHPSMGYWPDGHEFFVGKVVITDMWLLDEVGGASILDVEKYYDIDLFGGGDDEGKEDRIKESVRRGLAEQEKMTLNVRAW
uniref:CREG-like beta-barrel domain-containing protein n=1 Tax=Helicotheca tamesis TaxID=374047 RepID=A0A7S2H160_9STRA|mmetsp:Transcript_14265/g.19503  ORF Transcript_14265/g.19503 Transcript_14265/m.19503 type:complete len:270 (+) Transcript_14265:255-1064(+)